MARPQKQSLDYFPFDVDFFENKTIEAITGQYGLAGQAIAMRLLCAIYNNSYYVEWNDLLKMQLFNRVGGASAELIEDVVRSLVKWGFFDEEIFNAHKVLTSEDIQKVYFEATRRRKNFRMHKYVCQEVSAYINAADGGVNVNINVATCGVNDNISTQTKVNEIKQNEIKLNQSKANEIMPETQMRAPENIKTNFSKKPAVPEKTAVEEVFLRAGGSLEMASQFYNKHQSTSWYLGGSPITNFETLVPSFIRNWQENLRNKSPNRTRYHPSLITRKMDYSTPM